MKEKGLKFCCLLSSPFFFVVTSPQSLYLQPQGTDAIQKKKKKRGKERTMKRK